MPKLLSVRSVLGRGLFMLGLFQGSVLGLPETALAQEKSTDQVQKLQSAAIHANAADWAHWGPDATKYSSWTSHSNRLIPVYTFGIGLDSVRGTHSPYRSEERIKSLYGYLPENTLNPEAEYFDQTDVYTLQQRAIAEGKKRIVLFVFDGMDWQTTRAAAIYRSRKVGYDSGRGTGLRFQDYDKVATDFGYFVTSPANEGTNINVDDQKVTQQGPLRGGFDWKRNGEYPWSDPADIEYPIGKGDRPHAYTDSSSSATSMTAGIKTYNDGVNVDPAGRPVVPITRKLQSQGFAIGVVTSVPISHATPACAYANNVFRDDYQDLTNDMLGVSSVANPVALPGVDVLIGGGWNEIKDTDGSQGKNFVPGNRYLTDATLKQIDCRNGGRYEVAIRTSGKDGSDLLHEAAERAIADKKRLFGYFGVKGGHFPFRTADGSYDPTVSIGNNATVGEAEKYSSADIIENPTLADATRAALNVLESKCDRWWLMVEAGDVDWANHANNIDNSIGATLSGDEAFAALTKWLEEKGLWSETAVILTADHGHYLFLKKPEALLGH